MTAADVLIHTFFSKRDLDSIHPEIVARANYSWKIAAEKAARKDTSTEE